MESPRSLSKSPQRKRSKSPHWTAEEDQFLLRESKVFDFTNWKIISKRLNKQFPECFRSMKDCHKRALRLAQEQASREPWSFNEDCVLLLAYYKAPGRWFSVWRCLPKRGKQDIKARFYQLFSEIAAKIQSGFDDMPSTEQPLEQLKYYLCVHLAVQWLESTAVDKKTAKILNCSGITAEQCLASLKGASHTKIWTKENLANYIEAVVERVEREISEMKRSIGWEKMLMERQAGPIVKADIPTVTVQVLEYDF